ncbi:helix-turn-helix transcriptional regulator [Arthrobacter sp. P2b]|uniref:helix-turn-helix transcriptional regulator n=1 Tax=Arthrobacter sp. P2b TaxID=1938741 RepID=UPI0009CD8934|nr:hypothetical protein [Arthrobacter sp. P2b]SLK12158.1 regulatory protein, luxR family [Arthrobacter sp. P2b]
MKERPLKQRDSFWGDLANAIALRPAYRPPADIPQATKTVTLRPTAESSASTAQQKAEEKAQTAVQHEAQEESTTSETTAPLYRYLKEEQRKAFAPTAESERMVDAASLIQDLTEQELRTITTDAINRYQLQQAEQRALKALDGTEFVSAFPQEFLDRLRRKNTADKGTVQGSPPTDDQSESTGVVVKESGFQWNQVDDTYSIRSGSPLTGWSNYKYPADHVEVTIIGGKHSDDPDEKQTGQPLPPSSSGGKYTVVDGKQVSVSTHEAVEASPESAGSSSPAKSSGFTRKRTIPNLPSGTGRVQRILKPKLKASQLKGMGFSQQEATVLEGLFRGRRINSIAARLSTKPATVLHVVKQLMAKFEAPTMNSLLKKVWSLHRDSKQMTLIQAAGLRAVLSDEPPRSETQVLGGLVVVNSGTVIERPKGINIPAGHPDHPANDEGAKKRGNQEGKRTPAHSKATPSPRKNTDS